MELNNAASVREMFECMSTEALKEILNNELRKESVDDNAICMISNVLKARHNIDDVQITPSIQMALDKYQSDSEKIWITSRRKRRLRNWALKLVVATAVFAILLTPIIPKHAGAENIWQKIASWTSDLFGFYVLALPETASNEQVFRTEITGLQEVYDAATNIGISVPVVPTWLPGSPEFIGCKTITSPAKDMVKAIFNNDSGEIVICINKCHAVVDHRYHKDDVLVSPFEANGIVHNIMSNNSRLVAVWSTGDIECSITIDCQEDVLIKILESIYVMGAN